MIDMVLQFFVEYTDQDRKPVRELSQTSWRYLTSQFSLDLIALVPFSYFTYPKVKLPTDPVDNKRYYDFIFLLYFLKLLRLSKVTEFFTPRYFSDKIKLYFSKSRDYQISILSNFNRLEDYNKIVEQI